MSGKLVSLIPPKGSYWDLGGLRGTVEPHPGVIGSEGSHALAWDYIEEPEGTQVKFTLKRFTGDTAFLEGIESVSIPLAPAFTLYKTSMEKATELENHRVRPQNAFYDAAKVSNDLDALNEAMQDQNEFLAEILGKWLVPSPQTNETVSTIYMCISLEVSMGFDMYPGGPGPGFPGK